MWKEGTIDKEYNREYETENQDNNYDTVKDTLENISDPNPQVSGNILPRKPPILDISTVDMLDKSSDNEKMQANCCVLQQKTDMGDGSEMEMGSSTWL